MAVSPTVAAAPASLYVGDLHPDIADGQLLDAFAEFKSLASVRICRDSSTGRSLCYGYVNFISPQDAIRAIEVKNHSTLNGRVIRVMWAHRDPDARKSGIANVFVKIIWDYTSCFKNLGKFCPAKLSCLRGSSKGYGFVQFESEESANAAIEKLNGSTIRDKQIYVGKFIKKNDRILPGPDSKFTNLFMKNLDPETTEELLQEKFSSFGKIVSLAIAKDDNGLSKGFGFVNYDNPDDAKRAMESMNGSQLGSKIIYVARAQKKAEREQILHHQFAEKRKEQILKYKGSNIYVKNIDDDVSDEELRDHFSLCGTITSAKIMRDDKGISKGFGFVCFSTPEEANKAVNSFHAALSDTALSPLGLSLQCVMATGIVSQVPSRPGLLYQPLGLRPGWRPNGFASPPTIPFQQSPVSAPGISTRQLRQNRSRMNGQAIPQGNVHLGTYIPQAHQPSYSTVSSKESTTQQVCFVAKIRSYRCMCTTRVLPCGLGRLSMCPAGANMRWKKDLESHLLLLGGHGSEMLHSMLTAATPEQQKQILGEHLYPLVHKLKPSLAAKITGMLLEMDNGELLLLLESPESLSAKVEEAVQVLKNSKTKVSGQDVLHSSYLSAEVAVN
ncbi:polyadenylate-binding protein 7-like [Senna tora]|uniref:Polyadenylate-binding protein 7-like n=1 Tax=Senna tora TaxID=362788 RepID=A0A834SIY8_9FABA|nr:polyadenylate-binding protein 7-like [Senna tora]